MATRFLTGTVWTDETGYAHIPLPPYLRRTAPKFRFELHPQTPHVRAQLVMGLPTGELTIHTDIPHEKVAWAAVPCHATDTDIAMKQRQPR